MKKILSAVLSASIVCTSAMGAWASVSDLKADFDAKRGKITVSGTSKGITTIMITEYGKTPSDYSTENLPTDYHQIYSAGDFTVELGMPTGVSNGKYSIFAADRQNSAETSVMYFDNASSGTAVRSINGAMSESDFISKTEANAEALGVDINADDYDPKVLGLMYGIFDSYIDGADFYDKYTLAKVIYSLTDKDASGVETILKANDGILGIDYEDDYESNSFLSTDAKAKLCSLLASMDYTDEKSEVESLVGEGDFDRVYDALCALSVVATEDGWKKIEALYKNDSLFLKEKILSANPDYSKVNSSTVFMNMTDMSYNSISDLKDNFDDAVDAALNAKDNSKPSGGPSGSSGGGGGGSYQVGTGTASAPQYEELPGSASGIRCTLPSIGTERASYTDVSETDWYYDSVTRFGGSGIVAGYGDGSFLPSNSITRAEFAKLITEAFSIQAPGASFDDVASDSWYAPYVSRAAGAGIIKGYEGNFNPDSLITRQDAVVILYRTAALTGHTYNGFAEPTDVNDVSVYAWPAVGAFYNCGILGGYGDGKVMPLSNITRAEAVEILFRTVRDLQSRL